MDSWRETHRVRVQSWYGDQRPSRRRYTMSHIDGGQVAVPTIGRCETVWEWRSNKHGARIIAGRERNSCLRGADYVAHETVTRRDGGTIVYVFSRWEGITRTYIVINERIPL